MEHSSEIPRIVTRFAPSPTGFMHIGGIRTALFSYLWARKNGGTFILRIEDTDKAREVAGSREHIQEALQWLGIQWDFGPDTPGSFGSCIQSERLAIYKKYAQQLVDAGHAYPDPYTEAEMETFRAQADAEKRPFLFRNHRPETFLPWDGTQPLRFKIPDIKRFEWIDAVRGPLTAGEESLDDFIIMKSDGYPTYNLAHIVDDYEMGVTHIMRGDEFIASTPKFLSLYDALEFPRPVFVSLPPILRSDRSKKLGKRDGAKDILDYRTEGYLPIAMINYLALIGWNPGTEQEIFSMEQLIEQFSLERVQKGGGAFSDDKLDWVNREQIKLLSSEQFWAVASAFIPEKYHNDETVKTILHSLETLIREKITTFSELHTLFAEGEFDYFFNEKDGGPVIDTEMLVWKTLRGTDDGLVKTKELLTETSVVLGGITDDNWNKESISAALMPYAESVGKGLVLWPLRVALSGKEKSPDPFELAGLLGKETTLARITRAIQ